jgi:hypothetical protein
MKDAIKMTDKMKIFLVCIFKLYWLRHTLSITGE